ncbi:hypothetical protein NQD34_009807 [Periophthalmus magnuspinnatus]|nr:hypothetical protein NQD34_009807 [Periophthalmus magnuspinnatus]
MNLSEMNAAKCIMVSGVTHTVKDDELISFLKQYGSIEKSSYVNDVSSPYFKNLIIEFSDSAALTTLEPILPYNYSLKEEPDITFRIQTFPVECTDTVGGAATTSPDYLDELRYLARRSGQNFELVLKDVMTQISQHLDTIEMNPDMGNDEDTEEEGDDQFVDLFAPLPGQQGAAIQNATSDQQGSVPAAQQISLSSTQLNPPEVQKVVVEHIVKTGEMSAHSLPSVRLRTFSGKTPKSANESEYEAWRAQIESLMADPALSPLHVTRRILESLLSPAADVVRALGPNTLPTIYLKVLDSAYATVQDGEELFAQFLNTLQDPGEKPSAYLQRLSLTLNTVVKRGGVSAQDVDKHLLKQFCRGCWDNAMITKLQLEQRKSKPPVFSELLLMLRTEEDRQQAKETLMKKHLGSSKQQRVQLHTQGTCSCGHTDAESATIAELKQQMRKLQQQMSTLLSQQSKGSVGKKCQPQGGAKGQPLWPKPGFCFKCGEDGHIAPNCTNSANPTLVQQKKKMLQQRREAWAKNKNTGQLN